MYLQRNLCVKNMKTLEAINIKYSYFTIKHPHTISAEDIRAQRNR